MATIEYEIQYTEQTGPLLLLNKNQMNNACHYFLLYKCIRLNMMRAFETYLFDESEFINRSTDTIS